LCQIKEVPLFFHLHLLTSCTCVHTIWCMIVLFMCHSVLTSLVMSCSWYILAACWWLPPEMFTLAKSCLCSTTFKFEVMTAVYMFGEDEIKNKCAGF
jgi:hypothetical protein